MAEGVSTRVKIPKTARAGEAVTVKTLITHRMEGGQRKNEAGEVIPRSIVNRFSCAFNGQPVIDIDIGPGVSANPYFRFEAVVQESGTFTFTWYDDDGSIYEDSARIVVT